MVTLLRFTQLLSLGVWVGGGLFVGVLLAPGAFAMLPTRELAGNVVGMALARLHMLGYACGAVFLVSSLLAARSASALARPAAICVIAMLLLTAATQLGVNAKVGDLREQMRTEFGSVDATPRDHALRQTFGKWHGISSAAELLILLLGVAALYLESRT